MAFCLLVSLTDSKLIGGVAYTFIEWAVFSPIELFYNIDQIWANLKKYLLESIFSNIVIQRIVQKSV